MNSYERAISAIELEEPDRVPLFEMHISPWIAKDLLRREPVAYNTPRILDLLAEKRNFRVNEAMAADLENITRLTKLDFIRVPHGRNPSLKVRKIGKLRWLIGGTRYAWKSGTLWREELDFSKEIEIGQIVESIKESIEKYESGEYHYTFHVLKLLAKRLKGKFFLTFDSDGSWGPIVSNPPLLISVLKWMYTNPSLPKKLIDTYTDLAVKVGVMALEEGADGILMCVDYGYSGGSWISPSNFRRFVKPALERQCKAFKKAGGFAILHSDGNIWSLMDDVVEAGIDSYQGVDVEAGMNLELVKKKYGDKISIIGNVSPVIIEYGKPKAVVNEVKRCIRQAAWGGGYILSTSANLSVNKNTENFLLMIKALLRLGKYKQHIASNVGYP